MSSHLVPEDKYAFPVFRFPWGRGGVGGHDASAAFASHLNRWAEQRHSETLGMIPSPFVPNPNPFPSSFPNQAAFATKPREKSAPAPKPLVQQRDSRPAYPPCCDFGYRLLVSVGFWPYL